MAPVTNILFILIITINFLICIAFAFDPRPMQDFCVADLKSPVGSNGALPCKDPATVTADDFYTSGLGKNRNTSGNLLHAAITTAGVAEVPGLNTMGLTVARQDLGPGGFFPPHSHNRATELHIVLEGVFEVGFVAPGNYTLYKKVLSKGDLFVVPMGLVHYQRNGWNGSTVVLAILNSQNPGLSTVTHAVFGAEPKIDSGYLARAYQLDETTIKSLQGKSWI